MPIGNEGWHKTAAGKIGILRGRINQEDLERVKGIEPSYEAWEAAVLPLNYTRSDAVPGPCSRRQEAGLYILPPAPRREPAPSRPRHRQASWPDAFEKSVQAIRCPVASMALTAAVPSIREYGVWCHLQVDGRAGTAMLKFLDEESAPPCRLLAAGTVLGRAGMRQRQDPSCTWQWHIAYLAVGSQLSGVLPRRRDGFQMAT
jgi:hypothetical protein